jgi:hypothetical protein
MHSRKLPLEEKKKEVGGWVLLDGFCTCTWALFFFVQRLPM